jgi:hypothetical protein
MRSDCTKCVYKKWYDPVMPGMKECVIGWWYCSLGYWQDVGIIMSMSERFVCPDYKETKYVLRV